jgi:hypothetical protein
MTQNRGLSAESSTLTGVPLTFSCKVIFADYPCRAWEVSAQSFATAFIVKRALHRQECPAKDPLTHLSPSRSKVPTECEKKWLF